MMPTPTSQGCRPVWLSLLLVVTTIAAGLAVRFLSIGLPPVVVKYGGSMLWALTIYWIVSALMPKERLATGALVAGALAAAVEIGKLYHSPSLDAFRLTLPGVLLLGRVFSMSDIMAYWVAIALGAYADRSMRGCSTATR